MAGPLEFLLGSGGKIHCILIDEGLMRDSGSECQANGRTKHSKDSVKIVLPLTCVYFFHVPIHTE